MLAALRSHVENVQVENVVEEKVIFENSPTEEVVEDATTQAETVAPAAAASLKSPENGRFYKCYQKNIVVYLLRFWV